MTYDEAAAAIGRRVRVEGGKYDGLSGKIVDVTRKLVGVRVEDPYSITWTNLSPYRLALIDEEETDANP